MKQTATVGCQCCRSDVPSSWCCGDGTRVKPFQRILHKVDVKWTSQKKIHHHVEDANLYHAGNVVITLQNSFIKMSCSVLNFRYILFIAYLKTRLLSNQAGSVMFSVSVMSGVHGLINSPLSSFSGITSSICVVSGPS